MLMHSLGVVLLSAVAAGSVPSHPPVVGSVRQPLRSQPVALYSAHQMEAYLSTEDVAYVRPGFNITLVSFQIPADRRPVAEVKFTDDMNQPLDRLGQVTPGAISASFILSWYDAANRDYVAYTKRNVTSSITGQSAVQATADSGGQWTEVTLGTYRYRFGTTLPAGFDQTKTTTLGIYGSRNLTTIIGKNYYKNLLHDFRPDGGAVTAKWDAIATATCNNCHDPLALHGGSRQEVKLCVLCHNQTQSIDPDTGPDGEVVYLSTAGVADKAVTLAVQQGVDLGQVGVLGFQDHAVRCVLVSRAAGMADAAVPEGVDLPGEYDPQSGQEWTRDQQTYLLTDLQGRLLAAG